MPLQEQRSDGSVYIVDEIVYVDGENDNQRPGDGNANIQFRPPKILQDVVSVEVSDIQISRNAASIFAIQNKLDFELEVDPNDGSDPVYYVFTVTYPLVDPNAEPLEITQAMDQAFNQQVQLEFTDGNWISSFAGSSVEGGFDTYFNITTSESFEPPNTDAPLTIGFVSGALVTSITVLFKSGLNASTTLPEIFGFDYEDLQLNQSIISTLPYPIYYYTGRSTNRMNYNVYNFIDITVDELPELNPVFRFFPKTYFSTRTQILPQKPRLLTKPIKKLERMTIRYRIDGTFTPLNPPPLLVNFRVFHLLEGFSVPEYVKERPIIK